MHIYYLIMRRRKEGIKLRMQLYGIFVKMRIFFFQIKEIRQYWRNNCVLLIEDY